MRFRYLLPAILWSLIILLIISIPGSNIPKSSLLDIPHFDKFVHGVMFAGFSLFLVYGFFKQESHSFFARQPYVVSFALCVFYGAATEILQHFWIAGRGGEYADFAANITGALAGMACFAWIRSHEGLSRFFSL